ncbi:GGDEF domain-containing protein [Undibacterium sp. SXout7W]|uniref:GGDEF domain-containing protein n=1 Tax=Undibacterium sp. SXout7W TaxID=3413049 RepID=UPI003BF1151E
MFFVHQSFKTEVRGINYWAWGQLSILFAILILAFRGTLTDFIVVPAYNGALMLGLWLSLLGTELFLGRRQSWGLFLVIWTSTMFGLIWWLVVSPSFAARVAVFSAAEIVIHLLQIRLSWRHGERHFSTYFFLTLLLMQVALTLVRGTAAVLLGDDSVNLLSGTPLATSYLAVSNILVQLLSVAFLVLASRHLQLLLERRNRQDPLTGLLNRRGCMEYYQRIQSHGRQTDAPLVALAIDIDHFKSINDVYGHAMGDKALVHVATQIRNTLREFDQVARFGGEEFVALLPGTSIQEAQRAAARIQTALLAAKDDIPLCTLSVGIARQMNNEENLDRLLARADVAMYKAKTNGRNRIELADDMAT